MEKTAVGVAVMVRKNLSIGMLCCGIVWVVVVVLIVGRGDKRAVTELSFPHVTTKILAYSGVFGFFIFFLNVPTQNTFSKYNVNSIFQTPFFETKC